MSQSSKEPLRINPFTAYRDPVTGQWMVIYPTPQAESAQPAPATARSR